MTNKKANKFVVCVCNPCDIMKLQMDVIKQVVNGPGAFATISSK